MNLDHLKTNKFQFEKKEISRQPLNKKETEDAG